jgi:hypothetical protein
MNETAWLGGSDPLAMLDELGDRISDRKLRLFAVACVRRVQSLVTDSRSLQALDLAEQFAQGLASDDDRAQAENLARYASYDNSFFHVPALVAVMHTLAWDIRTGRNAPDTQPAPEDDEFEMVLDGEGEVAPPHGGVREVLLTLSRLATREAAYGAISEDDEAALTQHAVTAEGAAQAAVLREVVGNPYRPVELSPMWLAWNDHCIPNMARVMLDERRWGDLPVLGDALEEAGCANYWLLDHLRGRGPHSPGCWALDLLLGLS